MQHPLAIIDALIEGLCPTGGAGPGFTVRVTPELSALAGVLGGALGASVVLNVGSNTLDFSLASPGPDSSGDDSEVSVVPHALKFARAYLEVLADNLGGKLRGIPLASTLSLLRRALRWPLVDFVKNAKYLCACPMACYLGNDLPSPPPFHKGPDPPTKWVGIFGYTGGLLQVLKNRVRVYSTKNSRLFASILQGVKRGCEVVPASFIQATLEKYRSLLSSPPPFCENWADAADFADETEELNHDLCFFAHYHRPAPLIFEASTSASYRTKRSGGGAREELRHAVDPRPPANWWYHPEEDLQAMIELRPGTVVEIRGRSAPTPLRVQELLSRAGSAVLPHHFGRGFKRIYQAYPSPSSGFCNDDDLRAAAAKFVQGPTADIPEPDLSGADVMVAPVLEPLKVRLITKGSSLFQWHARWLQKAMWQHLQTYPQFALTGRPLTLDDFRLLLDREAALKFSWDEAPFWVSGDYEGATDHLNIDFTEEVFETVLSAFGVPPEQRDTYRRVLYEQEIHFPPKSRLQPVVQANGQLMGSVLSFPVLCWVNLLCYHSAVWERFQRRIPFEALPVLVNGDDILFRCDTRLYRIWQAKLKAAGFILSLGKNYTHRTLFCVNSRFFHCGADEVIREIPWFNTGLLTGQSKLTGRATARALPLWAMYNETVAGACDPIRATRRFIHYNRAQIDQLTNHGEYNLFIAHELGGLGFQPPPGLVWHATRFQRQLATFLRQQILAPRFTRDIRLQSPIQVVRDRPPQDPTSFDVPDQGQVRAVRPFDVLRQNERRPILRTVTTSPLVVGLQADPNGEIQPEATWRVRFLKRGDKRRLRSWLKGQSPHLLSRPETLTSLGWSLVVETSPPVQPEKVSIPLSDYVERVPLAGGAN